MPLRRTAFILVLAGTVALYAGCGLRAEQDALKHEDLGTGVTLGSSWSELPDSLTVAGERFEAQESCPEQGWVCLYQAESGEARLLLRQVNRYAEQREPTGRVVELKLKYTEGESSPELPDLLFGVGLGEREPDTGELRRRLAPTKPYFHPTDKDLEVHPFHDGDRSCYYTTDAEGRVVELALIDSVL